MAALCQRLALLLALLGLSACSTPQSDLVTADPGPLPAEAEVLGVPFIAQDRYYCGPASLAMVLNWSAEPGAVAFDQDDLVAEVYTPEKEGTFPSDMLAAARRHGRLAVPVTDLPDLLAELEAGHPVLVFQNLGLSWVPQWHFAVAVGYDLAGPNLVLRSGEDARRVTGLETFEHTWARGDHWAITVTPPDRLPARASEAAVLTAAAGIERAGQLAAARRAYEALLDRWPESHGGLMGLGNTAFKQDDFAAAETAFRQAAQLRPEAPEPWNNLAYALARQDRRAEAIAAAKRAVALAEVESLQGAAPYRDTLAELSGRAL